jgi:CubicO group peptidase (beta-lactamase class C family)
MVLVAGCAGAPPRPVNIARGDYEPARQYLTAVIRQEMARHGVQGLSIALVDDQRVVWAEGFGQADVANKVPATADTIYRIGSISKTFTATAIMRLAERGKVDLDRPVTAYVPEFSIRNRFAGSRPMTLRALLAHHSGLPSDVLRGMWVDRPVSLAQHVAALRDESLASPPQTLYKYSNIGFSLLGRVIENVEHEEFSRVMQQTLLVPLGMSGSSFQLTPEIERRYARGYRHGQEAARLSLRDTPAGGMLSSVNDMSRWLRFIFAGGSAQGTQIIRPETLQAMFTPQFDGLTLDFGHKTGIAWMLSGLSVAGGQPVVWHNGGYPPYQAHLSLLPEQKLGVVILTNSNEAGQFITQLGTKALELASETKYGAPPARVAAKETPAPAPVARADLARFAGHYVMFSGQLGSIRVAGDQLKTSLGDTNFVLSPVGADTFAPKASFAFGLITIPLNDLSVRFQTVQGQDVAVLYGLPAPFAFARAPGGAIPGAWLRRLGTYRADTSDEQFDLKRVELATEAGFLVFKAVIVPRDSADPEVSATFALTPISNDEAVVAGIGNGEGGMVRASDPGNGTELVYSGFRFVRAVIPANAQPGR